MSDLGRLSRLRRFAYRLAKYHWLAPVAPRLDDALQGKTVVVVGSAPFSARPAGWDDDFRVISINASQMAARAWLDRRPDVTLMQFNQIEGTSPNAFEVRRVLQGQSTGLLIMLHWRHDIERLERGLAAFGYGYDSLRQMSRYERAALMRAVTGRLNLELEAETKCSNGIVTAALALHSGARRVILTGIDPRSRGHGYNALALTRLHAAADMAALDAMVRRGLPVLTADPHVAEATGLALWSGNPGNAG